MTHIAILEQLDGKTVDWMEKVSNQEYEAASSAEVVKRRIRAPSSATRTDF